MSGGAPGAVPGPIGTSRLSLNQATVKRLSLAEAVALCARHDIGAIGLWRDRVAEAGLGAAAAAVRAAGLHVSSLCRGGFFTPADADGRRAAHADNLAAIAEAAELGADALVLVCGGLVPGQRDLGLARRMVADAIGELVPEALRLEVRLGVEALHPMFCADRCVISSLGEAVDLALRFPADAVGVVVDTYHVWWDARLAGEIARAGGRIVSYQVCDWVLPLPADALLGRGHLGDGVIDFGPVTAAVTAAGYDGYVEVEIFNASVWDAPADETAATVRERFAAVFGGRLAYSLTIASGGVSLIPSFASAHAQRPDQEEEVVMALLSIHTMEGDPDDLLARKRQHMDPVTERLAPSYGALVSVTSKTKTGILTVNVWETAEGAAAFSQDPEAQRAQRESGLPRAITFERFPDADLTIYRKD